MGSENLANLLVELASARELDRLRDEGKEDIGRLGGVPIGIKDIYDVAGVPTAAGIQRRSNNTSPEASAGWAESP